MECWNAGLGALHRVDAEDDLAKILLEAAGVRLTVALN